MRESLRLTIFEVKYHETVEKMEKNVSGTCSCDVPRVGVIDVQGSSLVWDVGRKEMVVCRPGSFLGARSMCSYAAKPCQVFYKLLQIDLLDLLGMTATACH